MSFPGGYMWQTQGSSSDFAGFQSPQWPKMPYAYDTFGSPSIHSSILPSEPTHEKACARCKRLKIKCEMRSIDDVVFQPCRRCTNANYTCQVPEKKDRKVPVKRSDLMLKIQEQATQIQDQATRIQELEAAMAKHAYASRHHSDLPALYTSFEAGDIFSMNDCWNLTSASSPSSSSYTRGSSVSESPSPQHISLKHTTSHVRDQSIGAPSLSRNSSTGSIESPSISGLVVPASRSDSFDMRYMSDLASASLDQQSQLSADYTSSLVGWNAYRNPFP